MKKIKILICALAIALIGSLSAWSEELQDDKEYNQAIGIFLLGNTSADAPNVRALQYSQWFNKIGFQTEGFVFYNKNDFKDVPTYDFSLSAELLLKLFESPKDKKVYSILYAWFLAGAHGYNTADYVSSVGEYGDPGYVEGYYKDSGFKADALLGIGFGFDLVFFDHLSIPIQFGFEGEFPNDIAAGFCIGSGIRYKF